MPILFLSRVLAHSPCDARKQVINVATLLGYLLLSITASASPAGLFCLPCRPACHALPVLPMLPALPVYTYSIVPACREPLRYATWHCYVSRIALLLGSLAEGRLIRGTGCDFVVAAACYDSTVTIINRPVGSASVGRRLGGWRRRRCRYCCFFLDRVGD